jgi:GntR family transcriptional regulator
MRNCGEMPVLEDRVLDYDPPKYYQVKRSIVEKIDNDEFRLGSMIPSERELMGAFNVSRITIRKAIEELEQEGYLYKVQGKGTYVKGDQNRQNLISITSCTQDVIRLGMVPSRRVLVNKIIPADKKRQHQLELVENEDVFCLSRIYYADGEPINYTTTFLPYKYINGIEKHDFSLESLYEVIEKEYNIQIYRAERTIEAVIAHGETAEHLDVNEGIPLLLFQCVTYGKMPGKECPIETFKCAYRSDKFKFYINQIR